ncbi:50S ribosomal protein L1 [Patescibacteria group bacterium]|nr:50S ribosomal protein L1 [Patescibacteria group bacterium]
MGRPRIKTIDDSAPEAEVKKQKVKSDKIKPAKSETDKASSKVEPSEIKAVMDDSAVKPQLEEKTKTESSKKKKPGKAKPRSKKYQEVVKDLDRSKLYPLEAAVDMAKKMSYSKINATLEAHINTTQTGIRGLVSLPYAKGVQLRILCFGPSNPQIEGSFFGSDSTIEEINKGKVNFDLVITTPDWMPKLAKVARVLGPKGLMPNPKNGTIVSDLKKAVEGFQAGKTEYKTEAKAPIIHIVMGKLDQPTTELSANIKTLLQTLGKTRVKKLTLSPTMGPGVKVDLSSL